MKNIILLITDTYRYDNLFGRARRPVHTPCLDAFATDRATELSRFITGSFPTIPHRTDVTTGRLGWPWYGWQDLSRSSQNAWPVMLRKQGYATQLICDCPHLFNAGFQKTFHAAYQTRGQEGDVALLHLNDPIRQVMPPEKTRPGASLKPLAQTLADQHRWTNRYYTCEEDTFCFRTSRTAVRWLEENNRADPFFLWVDFFDPHEPWDPPEYLVRHYQEHYDGPPMIHPNYGHSSDLTDAELRNLRAHYAAEAELVDRALGRILQKIDDLRLWDDSLVVVTSDHGFSLGEHGRTGKTNINPNDERRWPIYPEVNHVPFLIAGSDVPRGTVREAIAQPIDILPTLSELAGAPVDMPEETHGRSFAGVVAGTRDTHRKVAVTASRLPWGGEGIGKGATVPFVTTPRWGYTPCGPDGGKELYDLTEDPLAERNVAGEHPEAVADVEDLALRHLEEVGADESVAAFLRKAMGYAQADD